MTNPGHATIQATSHYRHRFEDRTAQHHFRQQQNLLLSSIGIGTYLGNADAATDNNYAEAIARAVELGINVIDTAANYRFQRSERSIATALKRLTNELGFSREELVICTKGGYLSFDGAPPRNIRAYVEETFVSRGIATFDDIVGGSHCMTPAYLQNQIDQSLENMELECLDVYYIHNPESQLSHVAKDEFLYRLKAAFRLLEQQRSVGKIQFYGVATWNGFRVWPDAREYHSLEQMVRLARETGGDAHGFRFIQLPYNLGMPEALTLRNQAFEGKQMSVLDAAAAMGLSVVASASMFQGRVARGLPDRVRIALGSLSTDAQTAIQFVRSTPGITTALAGMSRVEHVEENAQLIGKELASETQLLDLFA